MSSLSNTYYTVAGQISFRLPNRNILRASFFGLLIIQEAGYHRVNVLGTEADHIGSSARYRDHSTTRQTKINLSRRSDNLRYAILHYKNWISMNKTPEAIIFGYTVVIMNFKSVTNIQSIASLSA